MFALIFYAALGILAAWAVALLATDLAVLFLRAIGRLPPAPVYGTPRSSKWPALERHWLSLHPTCAACGGRKQCVPHHLEPFHLEPEKELDPENLITLCNHRGCHLLIGHAGDWHAYNPHAQDDAALILTRVRNRSYE